MSNVTIRDLEPGDVEAIVEIAIAAWTPIYGFYRQEMGPELFAAVFPDWRAEKARQVRAACQPGDPAIVCVAERDGQVVGFITFYAHDASGIGEIGNNAVHPDWQRQGIGPMMYHHAFERLRASGMRFAKVCTGGDPAHGPARKAYEKVGFVTQLPGVEYYREL